MRMALIKDCIKINILGIVDGILTQGISVVPDKFRNKDFPYEISYDKNEIKILTAGYANDIPYVYVDINGINGYFYWDTDQSRIILRFLQDKRKDYKRQLSHESYIIRKLKPLSKKGDCYCFVGNDKIDLYKLSKVILERTPRKINFSDLDFSNPIEYYPCSYNNIMFNVRLSSLPNIYKEAKKICQEKYVDTMNDSLSGTGIKYRIKRMNICLSYDECDFQIRNKNIHINCEFWLGLKTSYKSMLNILVKKGYIPKEIKNIIIKDQEKL